MVKERDEYTVDDLVSDLCLTTPLAHRDAVDLVWQFLKDSNLHPYDVYQPLQKIVNGFMSKTGTMVMAQNGLSELCFAWEKHWKVGNYEGTEEG